MSRTTSKLNVSLARAVGAMRQCLLHLEDNEPSTPSSFFDFSDALEKFEKQIWGTKDPAVRELAHRRPLVMFSESDLF